ncbi:hypothetical protein D187_001400 [Cystobacter fuscus DSM 2262]|uniref:Uncharacterized protein n=1 Tax=Cystobacter fuscus (strain ATCC 25194 / DSM 2262 / NBRC 100088 / M29) TaxID=1242864 RepID=S9PCD6_CYSF2|nr:hypothetical protein [Cystobacter fuscus]EPX60751.1 hypothetical protein D187_001400 [Cystobacter fuscus DSM 2262]
MRGEVKKQATFLILIGPAERAPKEHLIRRIKALADEELERLSPRLRGRRDDIHFALAQLACCLILFRQLS